MKIDSIRYPDYLENEYSFPEFQKISVSYPRPQISNIEESIELIISEQLSSFSIQPGDKVGVGIGSRGIHDIVEITKLVCRELKKKGVLPFIIPAMGSHGGANALGQKSVLGTLGITEENCGCPIVSSMEIKQIGSVLSDVPVYYSCDALEMDHSICINRIKSHTKFKAPIESGILKMLCIGMGKHEGALNYHKWALKHGFYHLMKQIGVEVVKKSNFRFGIGIVENAYDETMIIEGLGKNELIIKEERLLKIAKEHMPKLPVKEVDVLVVQQIGKEFSGAGMDPNITGRAVDLMEDDFSFLFKATRLAVLNLSKASKGNATGMGNADIITAKLFHSVNYEATLMNILTGISLRKAAVPVIMPNDKKAIQACFTTIGPLDSEQVRAIIIKNTLNITECWVSKKLAEELQDHPMIQWMETVKLEFNDQGDLCLN